MPHSVYTSVKTKNPEIEALRAAAILLVLVDHLPTLFFWNPGILSDILRWVPMWTGVDLFFCISGYVITRSIANRIGNATSARDATSLVLQFWIRRFWRLFPSASLWLAVVTVCSVSFNSTGVFGTLRGNMSDAIAVLFEVSNIHFFTCYENTSLECGKNNVYWSLSVEGQFYLIFPIMLSVVPRRLWAVPFLFAAVAQLFIPRPVWSLFWAIRTDAIAFGVLLGIASLTNAYCVMAPTFLARRASAWLWFVVCLTLLAALPSSELVAVPCATGLAVLVSSTLVWSASFGCGYALPAGRLRSGLTWIGARSYAIYLIHWPVFLFIREAWARVAGPNINIGGSYTLRFAITALPLVFLLADLNYRFVERPLRRKGALIGDRFVRIHSSASS